MIIMKRFIFFLQDKTVKDNKDNYPLNKRSKPRLSQPYYIFLSKILKLRIRKQLEYLNNFLYLTIKRIKI